MPSTKNLLSLMRAYAALLRIASVDRLRYRCPGEPALSAGGRQVDVRATFYRGDLDAEHAAAVSLVCDVTRIAGSWWIMTMSRSRAARAATP